MTKLERAIRWALPELDYFRKPGMCYDPGTMSIVAGIGTFLSTAKTVFSMFQGAPDSRRTDMGDGDQGKYAQVREPAAVADPDKKAQELAAQQEMTRKQQYGGRVSTALTGDGQSPGFGTGGLVG